MLREARPHASLLSFVAALNQEPPGRAAAAPQAKRRSRGVAASGEHGTSHPVACRRGFACPGARNRLRVPSGGLRGRGGLGAAHRRVGRPLRGDSAGHIVCRVHRTSAIRVRVAHRPGAPRASRGPGTERGAREHAQRRAVPRFEVTNATSAGFAFLDRKRGDWPERVDDVLARRTTSRRLPWSSRSTVDRLRRSAGRQNTSNTPARFASRQKKSRLWDDVARRNPRRFLRTQAF